MNEANDALNGMLMTCFTLGSAVFGVDARLVQEVVKVGELTSVHGAPPGVVGIRNLRGRIVTVIDMSRHLGVGGGTTDSESRSRLLIMEHESESYGFLVDTVTDAIALDESQLGAPPSSLEPSLRAMLLGVYRNDEQLIAIIDSDKLFAWNEETDIVQRR